MPLLALFLFGIVQFGIAYDMKQSVNSAAREGARMAAIPDEANVTYSTIRARVENSYDSLGSGTVDEVTVVVVEAVDPDDVLKTCTASGCTVTSPLPLPAPLPPITAGSVSPCTDLAGETVVVTVEKNHDITIPFFGVRPVTLQGRGEFRCEIDP